MITTTCKWDQSVLDRTLQERLSLAKEKDIPTVLNRTAFFMVLGAIPLTPVTEPQKIDAELAHIVFAQRPDGSVGSVAKGKVIAAKRASKMWTGSRQFIKQQTRRLQGLSSNEVKAWRSLVGETMRRMIGGRKASTHFIRAGWLGALAVLAQALGGRYAARSVGGGLKARGSAKGTAIPATAGWSPNVNVIDSAQSRSDHKNGLITYGQPALEQSGEREFSKMQVYVDEHFKENDDRFNQQQH